MQNRKMKHSLSVLFALLLLAQTGCSSATTETETKGETTAATETETVETKETPDVPEADYGGTTFDILACGNWGQEWTEIYEFHSEELTGEAINDAVYNRNLQVSDKFNVEISEIHHMGNANGGTGKGLKFVQQSVQAADNLYDLALMCTYDCSTLAAGGYLLDMMTEVPYIDLSKSWWDQKAVHDLAIGKKMYYSTGDITMIDNECTFCLLFNKQMIEDYSLDDPYTLVKDGTWTIDKFVDMASQVSVDTNGDGKYTDVDTYGYCIWWEAMGGIIAGSGGRYCDLNEKGEIELTFLNERTVDALTRFSVLAYDRSLAYSIQHSPDKIEDMFANDQVLFYSRYLCIVKKYRDMDTDFGILPYPKYEEAQQEYYSSVSSYGCSHICVPVSLADLEMTGAVTEYMAAVSKDIVTPAYYEVTIQGKILRDEESLEMLDIILGGRVFDLGWNYQIGELYSDTLNMFMKNSTDFVSMYEKKEAQALEEIAEINAMFVD